MKNQNQISKQILIKFKLKNLLSLFKKNMGLIPMILSVINV